MLAENLTLSIRTGYLLPGATLLTGPDSGFFETYRGVIETPSGKVQAYVKLLGVKALVNELVSMLLGRASCLPVPEGFLVTVSVDDYPDSSFLVTQGLKSTIAYGSISADAPSLARRYNVGNDDEEEEAFTALLAGWDGWQEAAVFDEWIANGDRHSGNLLIGAKSVIWLIDHSHAFKGPNWHFNDLQPSAYTQNQLAAHVERTMSPSQKYQFKKLINNQVLAYKGIKTDEVIDGSKASTFLSGDDVVALTKFINERVDKLPDLLAKHIGLPSLSVV